VRETLAVVTMRQLLEAGVHFGHQTRRWNPKMKRFLHSERNGIYIVDLKQTVDGIQRAYTFARDLTARGGTVLFIGTKRQAQVSIIYHATRVGMPYVTERWLGGMLTNFETVKGRIGRLRELEAMEEEGLFEILPKKEVVELQREHHRLETNLGGIRDMAKLPEAVWVVDTVAEEIAVREANRLGLEQHAVRGGMVFSFVSAVDQGRGPLSLGTERAAVHCRRDHTAHVFGRIGTLRVVQSSVARREAPVRRGVERDATGVGVEPDGVEVPTALVRLVSIERGSLDAKPSRVEASGEDTERDVRRVG
jgi:ribosomal protein S2